MPRILIADDNSLSLQFFVAVLHEHGHECHTAVDGVEALQRAGDERFDVLLLDLDMPQLDGPAVLQRLRADPAARSRTSAAIATSAEMDNATSTQLLQSGFSATLAKPVSIDALIAKIHDALDGTSSAEAHAAPVSARSGLAAAEITLLDDAQALSSCGDLGVMQAMRNLFAEELTSLPDELRTQAKRFDDQALRERLHRLRASCGFCGASALTQACLAWGDASQASDDGPRAAALERLIEIAVATRARLHALA